MSLTLREHGIETVHDQVVALVAQRWAKAFVCKVTVRSGLEQSPWAEPEQLCDIAGLLLIAISDRFGSDAGCRGERLER